MRIPRFGIDPVLNLSKVESGRSHMQIRAYVHTCVHTCMQQMPFLTVASHSSLLSVDKTPPLKATLGEKNCLLPLTVHHEEKSGLEPGVRN